MSRKVRVAVLLVASLLGGGTIDFAHGAQPHPAWVGTWASAPVGLAIKPDQSASNRTYRSIVHTSVGGGQVRVRVSNAFGATSLRIGKLHIGLATDDGTIKTGSDRALTFGGEVQVDIPRGAAVYSDPISLKLPPLTDVAVSVYVPAQALAMATCHEQALRKNYVAAGDQAAATTLADAKPFPHWCFATGVDVRGATASAAIVTLGDSITDGSQSTPDTNRRWPDVLAARLQANAKTSQLGVLNEGIGGNRVLHDNYGQNALARFNRDVLAQSGVRYLIVLEGINDIGANVGRFAHGDNESVTAHDLIFALAQMASRAHGRGIKVYAATITPFRGAFYFSESGEKIRTRVNDWIRHGGEFDGVVDFDELTRDPTHPEVILPAYDSGDHLHPNDAGYQAMGDAIRLALFHSVTPQR